MNLLKQPSTLLILALVAGIICGMYPTHGIVTTADALSTIFINLLKLISLPLIFLALVATITQMTDKKELKRYGGAIVRYTLLTTITAAVIGLALFLIVDPVSTAEHYIESAPAFVPHTSYWDYILSSVPSNVITPFSDGNVVAILLLALLMSAAIMSLPAQEKNYLNHLFTHLFAAVLEIAKIILRFIPIAIWAFITQFVIEFKGGEQLASVGLYLVCVVAANLLQAFVVLPAFLKYKGISPLKAAKAMYPALNVAFWSKSSGATLPVTMQCATKNLGISQKTAGFSLPLCTAVNMNGCAAFILITVLFVSISNGMIFTPLELLAWIFIATLVAVGNAGVPMGCYFLSLALLTTMHVPLDLMFVILPFYAFIDMLETAINVWSDACVTAAVDHDLHEK